MSTEIIPFAKATPPKAMLERRQQGRSLARNFIDNVQDSFARLSIRGKVFSIRSGGEEEPYINPQTDKPYQELEVILVNASEFMAKTYYKHGFDSKAKSFDPPDCWSLDAIKPDPTVQEKQNPTCPDCRWNFLGSAPGREPGKRGGKACADSRRVVVIRPDHVGTINPQVLLLQVPQTSLRNLRNYVQLLDNYGWEPEAVVTKVSFDYVEAFPKLEFIGGRPLSEDEFEEVSKLADSDMVRAMLKTAPQFDDVASQPANSDVDRSAREREEMQRPAAEARTEAPAEPAPAAAAEPKKRGRPKASPKAAEPEPEPAEAAAAPDLRVVPPGAYRLETGELVDEETGEPIPEPAAKVQMPELDPDTKQRTDGRYWNKRLKKFVVGPELGARAVDESAEQPMRRGRGRPPKAAPAAAAEPEDESDDEGTENSPQETRSVNNSKNGGESVAPASAGMDRILGSLEPGRK